MLSGASAFARRAHARPRRSLGGGGDRRPLLFVAAIVLATFGVPVALGQSLLPQHVMPSVFPAGLTREPAPTHPGALTIDPVAASQMLPWDKLVGDSVTDGRLPLWNPYSLTGLPLVANIQSAAFFPLQLLQDVSPSSVWSVFYVVRFLIAGVFTHLFLRRIGLGATASAAGGVFYALSGSTVLYFRLEPVFNSTVALPVVLDGIERLRERRSARNFVFGAVSAACLIVSGQPEVTALNGAFVFAYSLLRCWQSVAIYPAGALLAAPFLLPVVEYVLLAGSAQRDAFGRIALSPSIAVLQVVPYLLGGVHEHVTAASQALFSWNLIGGYVGVVAICLSAVAIFSRTRQECRAVSGFAIVVTGFLLLKIYGLPPAQWAAHVPLLKQFFFTRYSGAMLSMAVTILVAVGAEAFGRADEVRARRLGLIVALALTVLLLLPVLRILPVWSAPTWASIAPLAIATTAFATIGLLAFRAGESMRRVAVPFLLANELMVLASPLVWGLPRAREVFTEPAFVSFLKEKQSQGFGRAYALDGYLYGNYAAAFGVHALNVCEGLIPQNIRAFASRYLDPGMNPVFFDGASPFRTGGAARDALRTRRDYYAFAGVRYLVASPRSGAILESEPRPFPRNRQNVAVGFAPGQRVQARMRLDRDAVSGIRVLMATYGRTNRGSIVLRVKDTFGTDLSGTQIRAADVVDNQYAEFRFPPIGPKAGDEVILEWEYVDGPIGDAVAFWAEPDSRTGYELRGAAHHVDVLPYLIQQSDAGWVQIYDGDARIWENPEAFPRAFVVPRVRVARTDAEALDMVATLDLREEAVVTAPEGEAIEDSKLKLRPTSAAGSVADVGGSLPTGVVRSLSSVAIKDMTPTRIALTLEQPMSGLLVMSDTYYPGWQATVDGVSRPVYETNGAFRGVSVRSGDREVVFTYRSRAFLAGLALSAAMSLCCVGLLLRRA